MSFLIIKSSCGVVAMLAAGLVLGGCGRNLDEAHTAKVKMGMSQSEVEGILGKGEVAAGPQRWWGDGPKPTMTETWTEGNKTVKVTYMDSQVVGIEGGTRGR